jgi:hypothetical protein
MSSAAGRILQIWGDESSFALGTRDGGRCREKQSGAQSCSLPVQNEHSPASFARRLSGDSLWNSLALRKAKRLFVNAC